MSCQLSLLANFKEVRAVKRFLFPHLKDGKTEDAFDGWDNPDWGWKDEEEHKADAEGEPQDSDQLSWLQACHISMSPAAELMAIAYDEKLVLLAQKWNLEEEDVQMKYSLVFEGCIKLEDGEKITDVLCLPLASQKRSTQGGPDWTCVIVGFTSGYVRMYTESGALLLSQIFSEEPVKGIKCRTYEPPRHTADAEKHEELTVMYKKSMVTIDGFSLFQSLRACRNQVARAAASGSEWVQPPPLAYKKWGLQEQEQLADHVACGVSTPNPFDQMVTGSMIGGHQASIRATPPASHLYLTTGSGPYVGFFYAVEGSTQPMLSDVAHAVATKLKSALFSQISAASGWLGLGGGQKQHSDNSKEKKRPKIEPATTLPSRFSLHDKRREGEAILLSPDNRLAAVTDSFGRVMLIDICRGVVVRMWKGYRDAQCGWVDVTEDAAHDRDAVMARQAMFLIIYAPRRGILEVWTAQQGPRVAAFNVSKWCRLLCPGYGMMGLNNVTFREGKVSLYHIYLVDPEGSVKAIDVPFHLALSDKNSKRARDMHLLKKLKIALKDQHAESGALRSQVVDILTDIKIASVRHQGLERVLQTRYLSQDFLHCVLTAVVKPLEPHGSEPVPDRVEEGLDYESKVLLQFCREQQHLLQTYSVLCTINTAQPEAMQPESNPEETLVRVLSLTNEEVFQLVTELDKYHSLASERPSVHFHSSGEMTVTEFLGCFECQMLRTEEPTGEARQTSGSRLQVQVHNGLSESRKMKLANFLFKKTLERGTSSLYNHLLKDSHIPPDNLVSLLLYLWLSEDRKKLEVLVPLHTVMKSICCLKDPIEVTVDHNSQSPWWQAVRSTCSQSEHVGSALLAALVGRSVAMAMAKATMQECQMSSSTNSDKMDLSEWESVTIDRELWTVLVRQLEDLLAVRCMLSMKPTTDGLVDRPVWQPEHITVSVKKVLDGGRGVIPEFVAKWIAGQGILPSMLCLSEEDSVEKHEEEAMEMDQGAKPRSMASRSISISQSPIIERLQEVQKRMPHSLDTDILMANCAWEYMVLWNKDPEIIFPLEQALAYLKCIQNAMVQHGLATMMWQMFVVKKLSSAAYLMEKVGKAPKDRLCRRDIGLGEVSLEKFIGHSVDLLETIIQARHDTKENPVFNVEDVWQSVQGPTSLVELAVQQQETNQELVEHHMSLSVLMHATLHFGMKAVKPLSLFDTKGRNAFFKPLHSSPVLANRMVDEAVLQSRRQLMCRVMTQAVQSLGERLPCSSPAGLSASPPASLSLLSVCRSPSYTRWPQLLITIAKDLCVDTDVLRRHHVCELYSSGLDKMADEVLMTVSDHAVMGSQLLLIVGQRLAHSVLVCGDSEGAVDKLSMCSPTVSTWLRSLDADHLRCASVPLSDSATLVGHVVNQLPEGHSEYNMAIELVELISAMS